MIIDISKIVGCDGKSLEVDGKIDFPEIKEPATVKGSIVNHGEQYVLNISVTFNFVAECARCLSPVDEQIKVEIDDVINSEENREFYKLSNNSVDITEAVYTELSLLLSSKYLCREDCKGLCPVCGTNLNIKECGCDREQRDSRFDVLKKLLKQD